MKHERAEALIPPRLAQVVEYTDLRKEITYTDVERMCLEARKYGFPVVVVPSALVAIATACLRDTDIQVGTVIGYPYGTEALEAKTQEIEASLNEGAKELDIVPHFADIQAGRWDKVKEELEIIRRTAGDRTLKLVLETQCLSEQELRHLVELATELQFEFVVNATGFRVISTKPESAGRATPEIVRALVSLGAGKIRVKAAGGVRSIADALSLLAAGAARVSLGPAVLHHLSTIWEGGTNAGNR